MTCTGEFIATFTTDGSYASASVTFKATAAPVLLALSGTTKDANSGDNILIGQEIGGGWNLDWSAPDMYLWEAGLKLPVPTSLSRMEWQRDSFFTDYPAGHLGELLGTCRASDVLFRPSKRGLH